MRRALVAAVVGFLVVTGLQVQPAGAATKRPHTVGLVSFVKAEYSRTTNKTSLSLDWPNARYSRKYEIFVSRYSSMKKAKRYARRSSAITIKNLRRGTDYYVQVRGVNGKKHGRKSAVVARTTILRAGPTGSLMPLRVMTFNTCSEVCDQNGTAPTPWIGSRQNAALERITASGADVVATQENGEMSVVPAGYAQAISFSAKRLYYKTARFDVAPGPLPGKSTYEARTGCRLSSDPSLPTGNIYLGRHSKGCRYAVWARLVERSTGRSVVMVDVHTVSGFTSTTAGNRRAEMATLLGFIKSVNKQGLPIIYAGDFNSHRTVKPSDVVTPAMRSTAHHDAYQLARRVSNQHLTSYSDFRVTPPVTTLWGNHIDRVFVDPSRVRVDGWYNFARLDAAGRTVRPIPSDHSPIVVDLRVG